MGKVNQRLKRMISKSKMNEIDIKLLKGIFSRNTFKKARKKGLLDTFYPDENNQNRKTKVLRRFNSFILEDSVENEQVKEMKSDIESRSMYLRNLQRREFTNTQLNTQNSRVSQRVNSL